MNITRTFILNKKLILWFLVITIAGVVTAILVNKLKAQPQNNELKQLIDKEFTHSSPLPEIIYQDYETKKNYADSLKQGKVLLVYMVTECFGCQKESEFLSQPDLLEDSDVKVFGIAGENTEALKNFAQVHKFNYPLLFDEGNKFQQTLNIKYFPTNFVIENGVIVKSWFGNPKDKNDFYRKLNLEERK